MAFANFFEKTAISARQLLLNFEHAAFQRQLEAHPVAVHLGRAQSSDVSARFAAGVAVDMLARLYPRICISTGSESQEVVEELKHIARSINPEIEFLSGLTNASIVLAFDSRPVPVPATCPVRYIGNEGWIAKVSEGPVEMDGELNPFSAAAAAALGAANVFRHVFRAQLVDPTLDVNLRYSLSNCCVGKDAEDVSIGAVDLGELILVGHGAVGNAFSKVLSATTNISGSLTIVEPEVLDLSNLQRYLGTVQSDVGCRKTDLAAARFSESHHINVKIIDSDWKSFVETHEAQNIKRIAVAVDSAAARRDIQTSLPRRILNAWTQPANLGISRHGFDDGQACLMCLYFPPPGGMNEDQQVADALKMPEAIMEIRHLLYTNEPVTQDFLSRLSAKLQIDIALLTVYEGKPLRKLYTEGICGGAFLRFFSGSDSIENEVPMAFQSALAGILLAADCVMDAAGLRKPSFPCRTEFDLLRPLATYLSLPEQKQRDGLCICQDPDYLAVYREKWS